MGIARKNPQNAKLGRALRAASKDLDLPLPTVLQGIKCGDPKISDVVCDYWQWYGGESEACEYVSLEHLQSSPYRHVLGDCMPRRKNKKLTFKDVKVGDGFTAHGESWIKRSTRTATIWGRPKTKYRFKDKEAVEQSDYEEAIGPGGRIITRKRKNSREEPYPGLFAHLGRKSLREVEWAHGARTAKERRERVLRSIDEANDAEALKIIRYIHPRDGRALVDRTLVRMVVQDKLKLSAAKKRRFLRLVKKARPDLLEGITASKRKNPRHAPDLHDWSWTDDGKKPKYRIFEGKDHFNNKPLYQVIGVNNDYGGEFHTSKASAQRELKATMVEDRKNPKSRKRKNPHPEVYFSIEKDGIYASRLGKNYKLSTIRFWEWIGHDADLSEWHDTSITWMTPQEWKSLSPKLQRGGFDERAHYLANPRKKNAARKLPTFESAKLAVWRGLGKAGWTLSRPNLKILHATSPWGGRAKVRLWFKPRTILVERGGSPWKVGAARSLAQGLDLRQVTNIPAFVRAIEAACETGIEWEKRVGKR